MIFTSYQFFIFLPITLLVYFFLPRKVRKIWLLFISYVFYMNFNVKCIFVLITITLISYLIGIWLDALKEDMTLSEPKRVKRRKWVMVIGVLLTIGALVLFKYMDFLLDSINWGLQIIDGRSIKNPFTLVMPIGISYYTLQVISYIVDIYKEKIRVEKNLLDYALYVSFFPKIIMGPIERASSFLDQVKECPNWNLWNGKRVSEGLYLMIWGYFQKLVVSDRLAIFVGEVDRNYMSHGTVALTLSVIFYFFQLYADFLGYMNIARGMAKIMGFTLQENFNAPYFAKSVGEYWERWHISFGTWLKDYIYIPLGGNRKGKMRKYLNLMITFLVSGLWHGASWHFVLWGGLHGIYRIGETILEPVVNRINALIGTKVESFGYKLMQVMKMWILNIFAFVLFKAPSAADAFAYWKRMFTKWDPWVLFDGSIYMLGINEQYFKVVIVGIVTCFLVDYIKYKRNLYIDEWLSEQCIWFRWGIVISLIISTVILGAYGPTYAAENFIYFQF